MGDILFNIAVVLIIIWAIGFFAYCVRAPRNENQRINDNETNNRTWFEQNNRNNEDSIKSRKNQNL